MRRVSNPDSPSCPSWCSAVALLLGAAAVAGTGCAREALPPGALLVDVPPSKDAPYSGPSWRAPNLPSQLPPPVAPYKWPNASELALKPPVPSWAGPEALPFARAVQRAAAYYQLPSALLWAVIKVESNFRHRAVSRVGARGLMQLMPGTARSMGLRDALDPDQNILGGAYYLRWLANRFAGDLYFTLAAYNAGPLAVARHRGIPPYPETENYVRQVLTYYWSSVSASDKSIPPESEPEQTRGKDVSTPASSAAASHGSESDARTSNASLPRLD
jgi:soluble lytic murein transglycosylase-like protein